MATEQGMVRCTKCGYRRDLADGEPRWCCPQCKVVYAKADAAPVTPNLSRRPMATSRPEVKPAVAIAVIALALIASVGFSIYWVRAQERRAMMNAAVDVQLQRDAASRHRKEAFSWEAEGLLRHAKKWTVLIEEVKSTPRFAVSSLYARMDGVIEETRAYPVSNCMEQARDALVAAMEARKAQVLAFARGGYPSPAPEADRQEREFMAAMARCQPAE